MLRKTILAASIGAGLVASFPAHAGGIYDPRALAMGGVGVTTATSRNASFFNPAALAATKETDDFAFNLTVGLRAADPDKLVDDIDEVEDSGNLLQDTLNLFNATASALESKINNATLTTADVQNAATTAGNLSSAINGFNNSLNKINQKNVELGAFGGVILAIPSKRFGIGLYAAGHADAGARFNYAPSDATLLTTAAADAATIQSDLNACASNPATCTTGITANTIDANGDGEVDNVQSTLEVRGALVAEAGLSLAKRFPDWGDIDIGITPKVLKVRTFNYAVNSQNTEIDSAMGKRESSGINFDVGVTKTYGDKYKAGFVIKNVLAKEYDLAHPDPALAKLGQNAPDKFKIKPQARVGVSHHTNWTTVGLDADLTKTEGLGNGFTKDYQWIGVGAELDLSVVDIRLGYKHDLKGNYDDMPSLGFGLYVFGLHVDAAVAGNDKNAAASIQIGLNF